MNLYGISYKKIDDRYKSFHLKKLIRKNDYLVWSADTEFGLEIIDQFHDIFLGTTLHTDHIDVCARHIREAGYHFLGEGGQEDIPYQESHLWTFTA